MTVGGLLKIQDAMVRKIVAELKDFDNLYYEFCNEPCFRGVTTARVKAKFLESPRRQRGWKENPQKSRSASEGRKVT